MPDVANRPIEDPCVPVGFQDTFFVDGHSYQLIGTGPHIADIVLQKKSIFIKQIVVNIHHRMTMITSMLLCVSYQDVCFQHLQFMFTFLYEIRLFADPASHSSISC